MWLFNEHDDRKKQVSLLICSMFTVAISSNSVTIQALQFYYFKDTLAKVVTGAQLEEQSSSSCSGVCLCSYHCISMYGNSSYVWKILNLLPTLGLHQSWLPGNSQQEKTEFTWNFLWSKVGYVMWIGFFLSSSRNSVFILDLPSPQHSTIAFLVTKGAICGIPQLLCIIFAIRRHINNMVRCLDGVSKDLVLTHMGSLTWVLGCPPQNILLTVPPLLWQMANIKLILQSQPGCVLPYQFELGAF